MGVLKWIDGNFTANNALNQGFRQVEFGHNCLNLCYTNGETTKWPLHTINGYMIKLKGIVIECNHMNPQGSGLYLFQTPNAIFIYEKMVKHTQCLGTFLKTNPKTPQNNVIAQKNNKNEIVLKKSDFTPQMCEQPSTESPNTTKSVFFEKKTKNANKEGSLKSKEPKIDRIQYFSPTDENDIRNVASTLSKSGEPNDEKLSLGENIQVSIHATTEISNKEDSTYNVICKHSIQGFV